VDAAAAPMRQAAEAIVLRLVLPARPTREFVDGLGLHRRQLERQLDRCSIHVPPFGSVGSGSGFPEILLLAPKHNAQRAIRQRPLQGLGLGPWRVEPGLPLRQRSEGWALIRDAYDDAASPAARWSARR
jgi:hypothetical protein